MQGTEFVPLNDAARELGMTPTQVRNLMRTGRLDIGLVVRSSTGKTCKYYVYRQKLDRVLGRVA